jgi:prepilin-type N-terminal cleavage/methylation domain-containing protein
MRPVRRQDGFTLVEMLIAMVLAVVVFGATLDALDAYTHSWAGKNQLIEAQDKARLGIDLIVRQLRNIASPVTSPKLLERATSYDLVFQTVGSPSGSNTTGAERVRYCIPADSASGTAGNEVLYSETQTWTTATAPSSPWSSDQSATLPCPDSPVPSGVGTAVVIASGVTNRYRARTDRAAFTYNNNPTLPTDLSKVFTVQIDLFVNPTPTVTRAETELRSGAFLRNQPRAPVPSFSPTFTGNGGVLLNAGASYSPDGQNLSYSWSCTSPSPCPQSSALAGTNTGLVDWSPGAGSYTVTLTVTDATGLTAPSTKQFTVP